MKNSRPLEHSALGNIAGAYLVRWKSWLNLAVAVFLLSWLTASHALNPSLAITGTYSFQVTGSQVAITVEKIGNSSSTYTSGSLRLELWATNSPYTGGGISGYQTATIRTVNINGLSDTLGPNRYFSSITATLPYSAPPAGYDYYTLILTEYSSSCTASDQFCIAAYGSFGSSSSQVTFSGILRNQQQQALSGATVTLTASGKNYSGTSDGTGLFSVTFDKTGLPTAMAPIITVAGYAPLAVSLNLGTSATIDLGTLTMEPLGPSLVVFDLVPGLHHLGDGSFSGSINSLFQMNVEGSSYSKTFTLSADQFAATGATITLLAKGLQCDNPLKINGNLIAYLNSSPADGSFGTVTINVPKSSLVSGTNTFTITSSSSGGSACGSSDLDDFEFTNGILRLAGISSGGGGTTSSGSTMNLVAGWNLLGNGSSGPINVATAFGDATKVATVWKWNAGATKWAFFAPSLVGQALTDYAQSKGYDVLTTVNGGEGIWVNAKTSFSVQALSGTAVTSASFQGLSPGWSLIAIGDGKTPRGFNNALNTTPPSSGVIPLNVSTLWAWDAAQANWYFYAPSLDSSGGLAAYITTKNYLDFGTRLLDPTAGFWVNKP